VKIGPFTTTDLFVDRLEVVGQSVANHVIGMTLDMKCESEEKLMNASINAMRLCDRRSASERKATTEHRMHGKSHAIAVQCGQFAI
jgi:hypothetical protein